MGLLAVGLRAYKDGPPPNRTGGFGGETCHVCHSGNPLNADRGTLKITGLPGDYQQGAVYTLTVALAREGLSIGGFQMTARTRAGVPAGSWRALDDRTSVAGAFVQHTLRGSRVPSEGQQRWLVEWTAPETALGEIVFHAAANASNDDVSALGDFIYTLEQRVAGPR